MHGERKVPGGKLVVVEAVVDDGGAAPESGTPRLRDVVVSGDFFLEPDPQRDGSPQHGQDPWGEDDALARLTAALEGAAVDAPFDALVQAVERAAAGTALIGFSPRDLVLATMRALGRASTWEDHTFELLDAGYQGPRMQMALDEVLARQVAEGRRRPTLRFWDWAAGSVIIGSFQSLRNEVDVEAADRFGLEVVRRITGGGAMFVEPGNAITYSLYVPDTLVAGMSFADSYAFLDQWVLRALRTVGVDATYQPLNDIASPQGKIGGAAQKRLAAGGVLHHVTMSYDIDAQKMLDVLRIGREKLSDKGIKSAVKRVDPLRSQTGLPREDVIAAMVAEFTASYGLRPVKLDDETRAEAQELADGKYADPAWLARVP
ncbi:lipoate--protein ligase family protein [Xylanimonas oleitrophica]|uniref:Lipoate--protein ligase family protein n=1 Tax=Xylanimonas oleitrophica TaxID=2607479 RepID=A0A2W5YJG6_9MICO|nr:biotin/lipoate A/B protein ligase family protein [Xylanimonas oleitrophica]PZR55311.1 lipoate--protein ligase family protein [Xylanimonas oleitrophica]